MSLNKLLTQIRPLVNASGLEKAAGLPTNTLGKHYRWEDGKPNGQPCHPKHYTAIVRALCAVFGTVEIGEWRIKCDHQSSVIFAARPIPGREAEAIEVEGTFEYLQPEWREIFDSFDFIEHFSE